ncbi:BREX-2 system adenine-specific DNA-methyltransferase PglX [Arthrobacter burdickii]|uniref:site-specific DNA-methyltransferase (adenine-specific) n=1 Tax=Arthrobacter burdickii TaxID=3035920 RepID=A0ABT8K572_9MICC|nr:BREX-2 system adenine-specific DNA-methyltransferase PglX [Arthrobacter burdickii]MDN4612312.1 BREX-2 system adenine-specific DNA-methyltransferase PglX [Arthrobacter burdickii]
MSATSGLTGDLRRLVLRVEDDLRERLAGDGVNLSRWQDEHRSALEAQRTSASWVAWRDDRITQSAVSWVLTTVFVRFAEDNALVRPVWISGPGHRRQEALDGQIAFFREHPELTDREWLLEPVDYLKNLAATRDLVGEHSALWQVQPSGRMATEILEFWRQVDGSGRPVHDLADVELSTRFLGDLYQDLSEHAKKTFALLQTPEFVEEFILEQTLTPALGERPLEGFKLIDPTCGSGHFLLGAFTRLTNEWARQAPGLDARARVQKALDAVHGVDLNPFAVAIARFRLTIAALKACDEASLELAPAFEFHLAAGDSLLHGQVQREFQFEGFDADAKLSGFAYAMEDLEQLKRILAPGQYDAVVGNPPYITVKDRTLNEAYRKRYSTCKGTYALTVPFMERFFGLAKPGSASQPAGWTGQITSNSFMKREFGSKLIENFLSRQDLRLVADTEGAWIPGHNSDGTPTVILIGRHQRPVRASVRAVLSKGLRETRAVGAVGGGPYWQAVVSEINNPGFSNRWVDIVDLSRGILSHHPWSLAGGGAAQLRQTIEVEGSRKLAAATRENGFGAITREDSAYLIGGRALQRRAIPSRYRRPMVEGSTVRDWSITGPTIALWPYNAVSLKSEENEVVTEFLWPFKVPLSSRVAYGLTQIERGLNWFEYSMFFEKRFAIPFSIALAEIATHNHFVLDRGGKVFNSTSPIIKLDEKASEDDHLALLGVLNSSTVCFWLKQVCKAKGGAADYAWARTYQFNGSNISDIPLPANLPLDAAQRMHGLSERQLDHLPEYLAQRGVPAANTLADAREQFRLLNRQMIAQQEELDWEVYRLYGLIEEDLTYSGGELPEVALGERAFEIALARQIDGGESDTAWFDRHGSVPVTEIPPHWPAAYRELVQRRLDLIESNPSIRLLERPEYKRRWASEPWEKQQERALRGWLLDRLEDRNLWLDRQGRPAARSVGQLADVVSRDEDFLSVLSLWDGSRDVDVVKALTALLVDESVPYLAALRLKDSGLRKREAWEQTWELQRREEGGEDVGIIPVPPIYTSVDFRRASWWQARGKLDVPKECFIVYPEANRSTDQTLLLGWAGWNHVEQFLALAAVMDQLIEDGAGDEQLVPLVAGLGEVLPWVKQWHAEVDPAYGVSMADFCSQQFEERAAQVGRSHDQLKAWRPTAPIRGRKTKATP